MTFTVLNVNIYHIIDGSLQVEELNTLVKVISITEGLPMDEVDVETIVTRLIETCDDDRNGEISSEEFIRHHDEIIKQLYRF